MFKVSSCIELDYSIYHLLKKVGTENVRGEKDKINNF